jgi:hypothetical protein
MVVTGPVFGRTKPNFLMISTVTSLSWHWSSGQRIAAASGAKIIGLANAGGNTINSIKQASEFGIVQGGQKLAAS